MGRIKSESKSKKKIKSNETKRQSSNKIRTRANYQERILAGLYTLLRRKHASKIHLNTLNTYLHKFSEIRSNHGKLKKALVVKARKNLEEEGLIEGDHHSFYHLKDSVKEGIKFWRKEKNDSDDDELATIHYFKSLPASVTGAQPTTSITSRRTSTTTPRRKSIPKKRLASSNESSSDESIQVVIEVPSKKNKKVKRKKAKIVTRVEEGSDSELSDLIDSDASETEVEEYKEKLAKKKERGAPKDRTKLKNGGKNSNVSLKRLTKAELLKKLEEASGKDEELKTLATGFKELEKRCENLTTKLQRFTEIDGNDEFGGENENLQFNRGVSVEGDHQYEDRGGMENDVDFDDSGYLELLENESVADTDISDSEGIAAGLLPRKAQVEAKGFDQTYPQLDLDDDNDNHVTSISKLSSFSKSEQFRIQEKENERNHSFNSNRIPSPAYSNVGPESLPRSEDDEEVIQDRQSSPIQPLQTVSQENVLLQTQTPALSSSPYKVNEGFRNHQVGSVNIEKEIVLDNVALETINELEKVEEMINSLEKERLERELEKKSYEEYKLKLESEIEIITRTYQDLVESNETERESLEASILVAKEDVTNAEELVAKVEGEKVVLQDCLDDAQTRMTDLEAQIKEITNSKEEAAKLSELRISTLEKCLAELTESFNSLQKSNELQITEFNTREAQLGEEMKNILEKKVNKPTIEISIETGEDPAFEELKQKLEIEKEEALERVNVELNATKDQYSALMNVCEDVKKNMEDLFQKVQIERVSSEEVKSALLQKQEELINNLEKENLKSTSLGERIHHLELELQLVTNREAQVIAESKALSDRILVLDSEILEVNLKLNNALNDLDEEKIKTLAFVSESSTIIERLQTSLESKTEQFSNHFKNLAALALRYGIKFSDDDPLSSLAEVSTELNRINSSSHEILQEVMSLIPARSTEEGEEVGESVIIFDLKKLKQSLLPYVSEFNDIKKQSEGSQVECNGKAILIEEMKLSIDKLREIVGLDQIRDDLEILGVNGTVEKVLGRFKEVESELESLRKSSEELRIKKDLEITQKSLEITQIEEEFKTYRRTLSVKVQNLAQEMGLNGEGESDGSKEKGNLVAVEMIV